MNHATNCQATEVLRSIKIGHDGLYRRIGIAGRSRNGVDNGLEQGGQVVVGSGHTDSGDGLTVTGNGRNDREFDCVLVGVEVHEELVDLVENFLGSSILAIDLVDHDNGRKTQSECL